MKKNFLLIMLLSLGLSFTSAGVYYYYHINQARSAEIILPFEDARDTEPVLDLLAKDRYWLIASADYSPEHALKTRSPNQYEAEYFGKMTIKVAYEGTAFAGFVSYYMRNFFTGRVLFLAVKEEFRKKGYGRKLLDYALQDLKKKGASVASLVTRVCNERAQSLYKKVGFVETSRDEEFVYFAKTL